MKLPDEVLRAIKSGPIPNLRDWRNLDESELTRGERVCRFIEDYLVVPEGTKVGKKVRLEVFQEAFMLAIYDNKHETDTAILSIGRKNGKTAIIALLMLAHIVGPEAELNSRLNSGAMSRKQAAEVYNYASKSAQLSPVLKDLVKCTPSTKTIVGLPLNTEYCALSADASTNIGGSPRVAVIDEAGQVKGPRSDFIDAISTAQSAHDNPLLIYISTQAATDADFLSIQIDDATINKPKNVVCHVYEADAECDVLDRTQWKNANPALGVFRSMKDMESQAGKANRMPSFENTFRNLLLNQRIASFATFINPKTWKANNGAPADFEGMRVYGGLDLSSHLDLTALVLDGVDDEGVHHLRAYFWMPEQPGGTTLQDREKEDRAPYSMWKKQGYITTTPSATINYEFVAMQLCDILADVQLEALAFDRWRIDLLKRELDKLGVELPLVEFGQGYKDMSPALELTEQLLLDGKVRHGDNPVLNMCAINAVAVSDPANNRKLEKRKATGRIDGMVAAVMAIGVQNKESVETDDIGEFLDSPIILG